MKLDELKEKVYKANIELVSRGLVIYTWGNVSGIDRKKGLIAIKPRGIEYSQLTPSDMVVTDMEGKVVEGSLLPSVDLDIHLAIYKHFKEIGGIAHTHSTFATAWAQARRDIPTYGTTHGDHFYGDIPCTSQISEEDVNSSYEEKIGELITNTFLDRKIDPMKMPAVLSAGHGPFTWGISVEESVENSVILEEVAKIAWITETLNPKVQELEKYVLNKHYFRKHGKNAYFYQNKESAK